MDQKIKIVLFDVGGVLLNDIFPSIGDLVEKNYSIDPDAFHPVRRKYWPKHLLGRSTISEFFSSICDELKLPQNAADDILKKSYSFLKQNKETLEVVKGMKQKKMKLGILSNNSKEWAYYSLDKFHLRDYFDEIFLSCDLHMGKPFPNIYQHIIEKLRLKPEQILFIDNKDVNISAAEKLGMQGIVFHDAGQLRDDLVKLGIL
ncbi:MAG: HAD family phosphatase [Nanoarchaeota archaeon]|nr:HAD family phosphatase [Nanoarchaeota archaeon]